MPDEDFPSDMRDEAHYRLDQILQKEKDKLNYIYDCLLYTSDAADDLA